MRVHRGGSGRRPLQPRLWRRGQVPEIGGDTVSVPLVLGREAPSRGRNPSEPGQHRQCPPRSGQGGALLGPESIRTGATPSVFPSFWAGRRPVGAGIHQNRGNNVSVPLVLGRKAPSRGRNLSAPGQHRQCPPCSGQEGALTGSRTISTGATPSVSPLFWAGRRPHGLQDHQNWGNTVSVPLVLGRRPHGPIKPLTPCQPHPQRPQPPARQPRRRPQPSSCAPRARSGSGARPA